MNIRQLVEGKRNGLLLRKDPIAFARSIGVRVGRDCRFLGVDDWTFGSEPFLITIGDHVTVTGGVRFVTHDGGVWVFRDKEPDIDVFGPITIGNNVFLGLNVILMPGVSVGDNSVVGAGSVVTKDIPPDSVAVGSPARVIRTVDEYRASLGERATFIRSLADDEKRRRLLERFGLKEGA